MLLPALLCLAPLLQDAASFPPSSALAEGISPESLEKLNAQIQSFVDEKEIVGAELLVLVNGRSILHEAYGLSDQEAGTPMETGRLFCVRSMTKPVIGTAISMLVDDKQLRYDDRVAKYLPEFDVEPTADITIEQLLHHTSGLPLSLIMAMDPREHESIRDVAKLGAGHALEFPPGTAMNYSDQGTDTLTAIIEVVTGAPAEDFVRARILDPLGMSQTATRIPESDPLRDIAIPAYIGSRGAWTRFWGPDEPALFSVFLGSQALYSTVTDYARFMEFWRAKGRAGKERLLRASRARRALRPGPYPMRMSSAFPDVTCNYGYLMQLWTNGDDLVAFGHGGSDGTHAWVFPEQKAQVLYFTQSRNGTTGLRVEEALAELFLGEPFDVSALAPAFDDYLGYYRTDEQDTYRTIVRDGDDMVLEILGKAIVPLTFIGDDRWKLRPEPNVILAFDRDEAGAITGFHKGDHVEFRFEPSPDLPTVEELETRVTEAHGLNALETLGPIRLRSTLVMEQLDRRGEMTSVLAYPGLFRIEATVGDEFEHITFDGTDVRYASAASPAETLEGPRADAMRTDHALAVFGNWRRWHDTITIVQRITRGSQDVYLVRLGDTSAPATTLYIDAKRSFVGRQDSIVELPGMGRMGLQTEFGNFRDVSGMQFPHEQRVRYANPMLGTAVLTVEEVELGVEVVADAFRLAEPPSDER